MSANHRELIARERSLDDQHQIRTRKTLVGPAKHWSDKSLKVLEPVTLGELRCNDVGAGKVLVCRVISKCTRTAAVQFIVESCDERVAPVHLHRWRISSVADLNDEFMIGSYFGIKEPATRQLSDDLFCIRIDCPSDLLRLSPSSPLLKDMMFKPMRLPVQHKTPVQYKDEGNQYVASNRYAAARESYSLGIDAASEDDPVLPALLVNRALCHLKLHHPGQAVSNCARAMRLDTLPANLKTKCLWRQALGAFQMDRYEEALSLLSHAAKLEKPVSLSVSSLQDKVRSCLEQRQSGSYDWPKLWEQAHSGVDILAEIAEYVDPAVEVRQVAGKGRGHVAVQPIKRGTLLLVQKPLALGTKQSDRKNLVVGANVMTESIDGYPSIDAISQVAYRWLDDDETYKRKVLSLSSEDVPPSSDCDHPPPDSLDISRLEAIFVRNSFHVESLVDHPDYSGDGIHAAIALYSTASMLNHSCIGNVTYSFILGLMFVRARRNISPGEELVDSYVQAGSTLDERERILAKHGFVCPCTLCFWDRRQHVSDRRAQQELQDRLELLLDESARDGLDHQQLSILANKSQDLLNGTNRLVLPDRPSTLRPSLYSAYRLRSNIALQQKHWQLVVKLELEALECLGCVVDVSDSRQLQLISPPLFKDVDAVRSCLIIASAMCKQSKPVVSRQWIEVARNIETGQAGRDLFELRYAHFARSCGIDLSV
ncbi:hypothetical protein ACM66B_006768 [Microbotryomycetes sp. NB124-2]